MMVAAAELPVRVMLAACGRVAIGAAVVVVATEVGHSRSSCSREAW